MHWVGQKLLEGIPKICKTDAILLTEKNPLPENEMTSNALLAQKGQKQGIGRALGHQRAIRWDRWEH